MALAGELIDLIIDHLHDDRPALKICSLLCKSWLSESRFHLFRKVILAYNNYEDFLDLLKSPLCTIGPHVRCLVVHFDAMPSIPSLTALPNVVSLRLHDLPQMFPDQAAVEALSGFRSVRRLTIGIWRITPLKYLIEVVSKFPTLEAFATDSFESNIATHDPGNVPVWPWAPCHLRSLCLSQCARKHILRALIDAGVRISELTLHNLADFDDDGEFGVDEEEMDTVSLFLKGQGSELKEFKWTSQYHILDAATSHSPEMYTRGTNLIHNTHLESFSMHISLPVMISCATHLLSQLASITTLTRITFYVYKPTISIGDGRARFMDLVSSLETHQWINNSARFYVLFFGKHPDADKIISLLKGAAGVPLKSLSLPPSRVTFNIIDSPPSGFESFDI